MRLDSRIDLLGARHEKQIVFNGPHMPMTEQEKAIILTQMIPGLTTVKKLLGMDPYSIEKYGDYILKSARETSVIKEKSNYILRHWRGELPLAVSFWVNIFIINEWIISNIFRKDEIYNFMF